MLKETLKQNFEQELVQVIKEELHNLIQEIIQIIKEELPTNLNEGTILSLFKEEIEKLKEEYR